MIYTDSNNEANIIATKPQSVSIATPIINPTHTSHHVHIMNFFCILFAAIGSVIMFIIGVRIRSYILKQSNYAAVSNMDGEEKNDAESQRTTTMGPVLA